MTTFFTSDHHFGHANIIKYANRPFTSAQEMNEKLITNWNAKVNPDDIVYYLGDFAFMQEHEIVKIIDRLNGFKTLIFGNHDKAIKKSQTLRSKFVKCCDYAELYVDDQFIVMSHYPMLVWNKSHRGSWMLHGHSHGSLKYPFKGKILDVGADVHNYAPISYEEIKAIMSGKTSEFLDHHEM